MANDIEKLNDNSKITANSKQLGILKKNFPECFGRDGSFISHKMEEIVRKNGLGLSMESYSLNWLGKSYAKLLANENPRTLLKEDKVHNSNEKNKKSQNILIKGDNLEVLKHLSNAYSELIKLIYIDPPYNTGSDGFVYNDDRKFTSQELSRLAGIDVDEAKRILEFTQSSANSHSAWLTFMYPRLYVARHLLKEDGVIFISIDDNEIAQLKILCNDIFGEENFEGHIHWRRRHNQPNDKTKLIGLVAEHILVYTKNKEFYRASGVGKLELTGTFSNPDNDPRGDWSSKPWKAGSDQGGSTYKIITPTGKEYNETWMGDEKTFNELLKDNRIIFPKNGNGTPRKKYYKFERELEGQSATNWWTHDQFGHNQEANDEITELFNGVKNVFSNPKPVRLIKNIIRLSNTKDDDIVLDFFAGSGTTAHAVMQINAEDKIHRKFITVQLDESTDSKKEAYIKLGYESIFDITKDRILKAAQKIQENFPEYKGDLGFKIYETIPVWDGYLDDIEELKEDTTLFDGSKLLNEDIEVLLTTWKVHDGMELVHKLNEIDLAGYKACLGEGSLYFMDTGFTTEALKKLIEKLDSDKTFEPSRIVLFGYNFASKHQRELEEALNSYANKKSIELDLIVRY